MLFREITLFRISNRKGRKRSSQDSPFGPYILDFNYKKNEKEICTFRREFSAKEKQKTERRNFQLDWNFRIHTRVLLFMPLSVCFYYAIKIVLKISIKPFYTRKMKKENTSTPCPPHWIAGAREKSILVVNSLLGDRKPSSPRQSFSSVWRLIMMRGAMMMMMMIEWWSDEETKLVHSILIDSIMKFSSNSNNFTIWKLSECDRADVTAIVAIGLWCGGIDWAVKLCDSLYAINHMPAETICRPSIRGNISTASNSTATIPFPLLVSSASGVFRWLWRSPK